MGRFRRYSRDKISQSCLFAASNHIRGWHVPFDSLLTLTQLITVEEKSRNIRLMSVLLTDCDHDGMSTDWPDLNVRYNGKLSQEKTFANWWKYDFGGENFCGLLAGDLRDAMSPNFAEKTFTNSHKTLKFSKVFSLKSLLLCGSFQCLLNWLLHKWREGYLLPTWVWKVSLPNVAVCSVAIAVGCDWFFLLTGSWRSWWPRQK